MRKHWPLVAAVALGVVGPLSAQFTISGAQKTTLPPSYMNSVGLTSMMPQINAKQAMINPIGNSNTFKFQNLMPNFSYLKNNVWPLRTGSSPIASPYYGQQKK